MPLFEFPAATEIKATVREVQRGVEETRALIHDVHVVVLTIQRFIVAFQKAAAETAPSRDQ